MTVDWIAIYAGPDQVMGVTSGIAGALGVLLIFWNKVAGLWFRLLHKVRPPKQESSPKPPQGAAAKNS